MAKVEEEIMRENLESSKNLESQTNLSAKKLLEEQFPYDVLVWELAEFKLLYQVGHGKYTEHDVHDLLVVLRKQQQISKLIS